MGSATKKELDDGLRHRLLNDESVLDMICQRAYEIFQNRGQEHGHDREDWLQAENEILDELIDKDLQARLDRVPTDFPEPEVRRLGYKPSGVNSEPPAATAVAPSRSLSDQPRRVNNLSGPATYTESPGKKLEEASKSSSGRKGKKAAEPGDSEATPTAHGNKDKKSGHKSKASKKDEKKSERREKGKN